MRAYTLAMLAKIAGQGHPVVENGIIEWTNNKVLDLYIESYRGNMDKIFNVSFDFKA